MVVTGQKVQEPDRLYLNLEAMGMSDHNLVRVTIRLQSKRDKPILPQKQPTVWRSTTDLTPSIYYMRSERRRIIHSRYGPRQRPKEG